MKKKNIKLIAEVKTLEDLNNLKLQKRYLKELKKLEFQSSLIQLQSNLSPENIKETLITESQSFAEGLAIKLLPSFILNFFRK
ncbi:MAG: hypothetical protein ACPGRC_00470 [Salibacteraceae bacterium]